MPHTVLIPFDGSAIAEHALPVAERLAQRTETTVLLLYAAEEQRPMMEVAGFTEDDVMGCLERAASRLRGQGITVQIVKSRGDSVAAIAAEAAHQPIDLIIMATRGQGMLGHVAGGSLADRLLEQLALPILLVRPWHTAATSRQLTERLKIIVPLDGSPLAESALPAAQWLAQIFAGELVLLRVIAPEPLWNHPVDPTHREAIARDYLQGIATRLKAAGCRAMVEVTVGEAARAINATIQHHDAALVVMATHGVTGLAQMPLGSVARETFGGGAVPTVLVRPAAMLPHPARCDESKPAALAEAVEMGQRG